MPADRRAGPVLVNQRHGERVGINTRPLGERGAQGQQEPWERSSRYAIVRVAEERDTSTRDNPTQREVRKRDVGDRVEQGALIDAGDEVVTIVKAWRQILIEEAWRAGHAPVCHGATA